MRYKRPDSKNALSILQSAERDMKFTLSLKLSDESGATIVRNIYESFRKLGDALMIAQGKLSKDHFMPIHELMKIKIETKRSILLIDSLRRIRHNINYYGYRPNINEVKDAISIVKALFILLVKEVKKQIL